MKCIAFCAVLAVFVPQTLFAHATLEKTENTVGASYKGVVRIGHGCNGSATTSVKIKIPEGLIGVKPMPKMGWALTINKAAYTQTYTVHGKDVSEGVSEIIWSGGKLLDENYDEFVFTSQVSDKVAAGTTLYIPVTQICEQGETAWVETPNSQGQKLKSPAPALRVTAGKETGVKLGDLIIEQPWSRETPPAAKVAAGYFTIKNNGTATDTLISVQSAIADTAELHSMSNTNGVMVMDKLGNGLEIKPSETVMFAPKGNHVMFMGLKNPQKPHTDFTATLVFEKAGRVEVMFHVRPLAAEHEHKNHEHQNHEHMGHEH